MTNKEYGSDFWYPIEAKWNLANLNDSIFKTEAFSLFFSGRSALYNLLVHGIEKYSWESVYLPIYYCHEVISFISTLPIRVHYYNFNPFLDSEIDLSSIEDIESSVFVNVLFFGSRNYDVSQLKKAIVIEDVTHNILSSKTSTAAWCFGSLRKELPVPMGGFCYSPQGLMLPEGVTSNECDAIAKEKISGMLMKKQYLEGELASKEAYRDLFAGIERKFDESFTRCAIPEKAKGILYELDVIKMLKAKQDNLRVALENLQTVKQLVYNFGSLMDESNFGLVLLCASKHQRNGLKNFLVANGIFPAILWPDQLTERDAGIEEKVLFIHVDFRYSEEEIVEITNLIKMYIVDA